MTIIERLKAWLRRPAEGGGSVNVATVEVSGKVTAVKTTTTGTGGKP
jgi:hypothetical protein